jgi:hypothetical protein
MTVSECLLSLLDLQAKSKLSIAEYLSYADRILVLAKGNLRELTPDAAVSADHIAHISPPDEAKIDSSMIDNSTPSAKEKSGQISKENQKSDLTRATGDVAVYKYYFKSIGSVQALVFLLFTFIHVFCSTFSRMFLRSRVSFSNLVLIHFSNRNMARMVVKSCWRAERIICQRLLGVGNVQFNWKWWIRMVGVSLYKDFKHLLSSLGQFLCLSPRQLHEDFITDCLKLFRG